MLMLMISHQKGDPSLIDDGSPPLPRRKSSKYFQEEICFQRKIIGGGEVRSQQSKQREDGDGNKIKLL